MPAPRIPQGFKPLAQGFSYGAPDGVSMPDVGGATPRLARLWDRGWTAYQLTFVHEAEKHSIFEMWFRYVVRNGSVMFTCPIDSGFGMRDHLCWMVPGTLQAGRMQSSQIWSVTFSVLAEPGAYDMTEEDALNLIELWEAEGIDYELLAAVAHVATVTSLGWRLP